MYHTSYTPYVHILHTTYYVGAVVGQFGAYHTLKDQSTQIGSIYGVDNRNRNSGLGYILHIWVLPQGGNRAVGPPPACRAPASPRVPPERLQHCLRAPNICAYKYTCAYIYTHMHMYIHIYDHIYMSIHIYTFTNICMYVHMCIHMSCKL